MTEEESKSLTYGTRVHWDEDPTLLGSVQGVLTQGVSIFWDCGIVEVIRWTHVYHICEEKPDGS